MVYRIYTKGENIDAEFGCLLDFTRFTREFGKALKIAKECVSMIDEGYVIVEQDGDPIHCVKKTSKGAKRVEIPRCSRCNVSLLYIEDVVEGMDYSTVGPIDDPKDLCDVCASDMGIY
jgi:hypothetical protein